MLRTYTTSPLTYEFDNTETDHIISVQNNASYDFSHETMTHDGLIELTIPYYQDYVPQQIPDKIFKNCADLSVVTGNKIKTVGNQTFNWCDSLKNVILPEATKFGNASFANCNLSTVILTSASRVTEIQKDTFYNNFRRPVSVYIPGNLSDDWYDVDKNNNWQYIISSLLSDISGYFEDKTYSVVVISSNNTYNDEVNNIKLGTYNQGNNCKEIWDRLYPDILPNFNSLISTLSILAFVDDNSTTMLSVGDKKEQLSNLLTSDSIDGYELSTVISSIGISSIEDYIGISSNTVYTLPLLGITQFPLYDLSALDIYERYRPLSSDKGTLSSKVDIKSAIDNIYRSNRNTVEELDDIFEPLSTFGYLLSTGKEISATEYTMDKDLNTVSSAIDYFLSAQNKFREIIK